MKAVVRQIDRALKRLYHLDPTYRAEDFLMRRTSALSGSVTGYHGALLVEGEDPDMWVGIFLSEPVREVLSSFPRWRNQPWSREQMGAFTIATEEISHFHYLVHHASQARQVSQLELELQGEIDKFLLTLFANGRVEFDALFEQLFYHFSLAAHLPSEERARYEAANDLARRFIRKHARALIENAGAPREAVFRFLRRFYRLGSSEKVSLIHR